VGAIPVVYLNTLIFRGNAQLKAYAQGGFTPATAVPPMRKIPDRCSVNLAHRRGGMKGQVLSSPSSYQHPEFHSKGKGNQQSPTFHFFKKKIFWLSNYFFFPVEYFEKVGFTMTLYQK
jgi:hypothetical protein